MFFLKKYPKHFLLAISCAPFIIIGVGVIMLTLVGMSIYYILGISLVIAGLKFPVTLINNIVMRSIFKNHLSQLNDDSWMGLLLEDPQTSERIKLVPDDIAVLTKENNQYFIITSNQVKKAFPKEKLIFENTSQNELFCSIKCLDDHNKPALPFMISPVYKEDNWYIASSGQKRFEWFMAWIQCDTEAIHYHSDDEILYPQ